MMSLYIWETLICCELSLNYSLFVQIWNKLRNLFQGIVVCRGRIIYIHYHIKLISTGFCIYPCYFINNCYYKLSLIFCYCIVIALFPCFGVVLWRRLIMKITVGLMTSLKDYSYEVESPVFFASFRV